MRSELLQMLRETQNHELDKLRWILKQSRRGKRCQSKTMTYGN